MGHQRGGGSALGLQLGDLSDAHPVPGNRVRRRLAPAAGVAIISMVAFGFATPSLTTVALIGAIPMTLAVLAVMFFGIETCKRRLEEITAEELKSAQPA